MYKQSKADPCLSFAWIANGMVILVAWVDDGMVLGPPLLIKQVQCELEKAFMYKHEGELTEYMGSKIMITRNNTGLRTVQFTQLVLLHKLIKKYKPLDGPASKTPAVAGQVLMKVDGNRAVAEA
jgi:hypothetical protein